MTLTSWGEAFQAYRPRGLVLPGRLSSLAKPSENGKDPSHVFLQVSSAVCFLLSPGASFIRYFKVLSFIRYLTFKVFINSHGLNSYFGSAWGKTFLQIILDDESH